MAGEASPEERAELERLIKLHPEWQYAIQNLQDLWDTAEPVNAGEEEDAYLAHVHRMEGRNKAEEPGKDPVESLSPSPRPLRSIFTAIAVAASILVFIFWFARRNESPRQGKMASAQISEISTRRGSKSRIQLPDGSVVWINSGSRITYTKEFGKVQREVNLTGEAFFDVVKDKEHPFIIHTSVIDIRVLGTVFNVRAYPDDRTTETSLLKGRIEVSIKSRPSDKVVLSPNEKLVVENDPVDDSARHDRGQLVLINKLRRDPRDSTVAETQWTENKLVFDDESLKDIATRMERWFNVEIEITDNRLAEKRLTGKFDGESIEQALEGLAYTSTIPFAFERKANKIIIHR